MSDQISSFRTTLTAEEVVVRAVQFFSSAKWQPSGQSGRTATFRGMPPIPWGMMLLTILGFMACIVPGVACYILLIQKARRFQNLVVTANPLGGGSEVVVNYPSFARDAVAQFGGSLTPLELEAPNHAPS